MASISLPAAGLFLRSWLRSMQGPACPHACTPWCKFRPPAGLRDSACALGVQKSRELVIFHGIAFRDAEPRRTMETPTLSANIRSAASVCITPSLQLSNSRICGSHGGTRVVAHQALPFVTAAGLCVGACAMIPELQGNRNKHILSRTVQLLGQNDI